MTSTETTTSALADSFLAFCVTQADRGADAARWGCFEWFAGVRDARLRAAKSHGFLRDAGGVSGIKSGAQFRVSPIFPKGKRS